jgi:hypothetical protein
MISVKYGKTNYEFNEDEVKTIGDLKDLLKEQIKSIEGDSIRLISAGKTLSNNALLTEIDVKKFTMMASTKDSLIAMEDAIKIPTHLRTRVKDDLDFTKEVGDDKTSNTTNILLHEARFDRVETLPGLPQEDHARRILLLLANDEGVIKCMQSHNWRVGALCELYPEGEVGVSDVCILGLNENQGQRILLRLRTDDLTGFRNMNSIRKVLCHELSHNVHKDHDSAFYTLMRQVEKEVESMNWRKTKGNTVDGYVRSDMTYDRPGTNSSQSDEKSVGHVLDPDHVNNVIFRIMPPKVLAGMAATLRLSAEEAAVEHGCGCQQHVDESTSQLESANNNDNDHNNKSMVEMEKSSDEMVITEDFIATAVIENICMEQPVVTENISVPWTAYNRATIEIRSRLDEALALSMGEEAHSVSDKISALYEPLMNLLTDNVSLRFNTPEDAIKCVSLITKIVINAKLDSSKRCIQVSKSKVFRSLILCDIRTKNAAYNVLKCSGFTETGGGTSLQWTRNDVTVLSIVGDILQTAMDLLDSIVPK